MKLDRSTTFILLGLVIVIVIFNIVTREGFYEEVVIRGTGLTVGKITGKPNATPKVMPKATPKAMPKAMPKATPNATTSPVFDLPAATVTVQPDAPLTQVGSFGMQPIATQQVTDIVGRNAVSSIQKGVVSTDSMPGAIAPTRGSVIGPRMGPSSCKRMSMDSCSTDSCEDDCNDDGCN